jgi:hypothetical protein
MKQRYLTALVKVSLVALLAGCATSSTGVILAVPETLAAPAGQILSLEAQAAGVQIYECKPGKDDRMRFEWVFKAPEAELFDRAGYRIGMHYAGPT